MGQISKIEWTDATWNPVRGCSRVSPGCVNCYAERYAARFAEFPGLPFHTFAERTPSGPRWTGRVELMWDKLGEPCHWRAPKRIFVNSMSDLMHESLTEDEIAHVFKVMYHENQHTYQVLTKRAERLPVIAPRLEATFGVMQHVWLGVSVEDVKRKERIRHLQETPWPVRFLSCEPLLEDLGELDLRGIAWVIIGGESGPDARPCRMEWIRSIIQQCDAQDVAVFFKQAGGKPCVAFPGDLCDWAGSGRCSPLPGYGIRVHLRDRKGGDLAELPEEFHRREFPEAA